MKLRDHDRTCIHPHVFDDGSQTDGWRTTHKVVGSNGEPIGSIICPGGAVPTQHELIDMQPLDEWVRLILDWYDPEFSQSDSQDELTAEGTKWLRRVLGLDSSLDTRPKKS